MTGRFDISHIVAPTEMSPATLPALRFARLFAHRFGARLTVVYCDPVVYPLDGLGTSATVSSRDEEEHLRAQLLEHAKTALGDQPCELRITAGQPIPAILQCARDSGAGLIVVGTHVHHGWNRALFGSVSDGVLYGSDCPVLIVASDDATRGDRVPRVRTIVCPVNASDAARESLRAAGRVARAFGAELLAVHVVEPELSGAHIDDEIVKRWAGPQVGFRCTYRELMLRGSAAERLLDCAEDVAADLIVIGAQHKLFRNATVIGATADRLIRFASCPVLVVPRPAAAVAMEGEAEHASA